MSKIIKLRYGNTNTFLIKGEKYYLLFDTDYTGTIQAFYKELKKNKIKLNDIKYLLASHYHPDHIGLVSELMKQGIQLLLLDTQYPYIHFSDYIFNRDNKVKYEPIDADKTKILNEKNSRAILKCIGIDGEIICTTSHSLDSISLILDDGNCFVADLEPFEYLDAYEDNSKLKKDWELIMSYNPKTIYYAHANEKNIR